MICNPEIGNKGRLGNILFQYAAVIGLAKLTDSIPILPSDIDSRSWHSQVCPLKYFKIKRNLACDLSNLKNVFIPNESTPPKFARDFDKQFLNQPKNTILIGHFENPNYFKNAEEEIKEQFQLIDSIKQKGSDIINTFRNKFTKNTQIIAIHLRLGDANSVNKPFCEDPNSWLNIFFKTAISKFDDIDDKIFLCFTGGIRDSNNDNSDLIYLENFIKKFIHKDIYFSNNDYIIDFSIITQIDHVIVLTFSTFIWWACFLNNNPNKMIIVPKDEFYAKDTDFWHSSFIKI